MIETYKYELWTRKKQVGVFNTTSELFGNSLIVYESPLFKQPYGKKIKTIEFPLRTRVVFSKGPDMLIRKVIDVSRKSKRQIGILNKNGPYGLL